MKKIMFLLIMIMGLMTSLSALDTGQIIVCDIKKSQIFSNIDGVVIAPADVTYTSLEHLYDKIQAIFNSSKIGYKHYNLILKQDKISLALDEVDICIINGGYSSQMDLGRV